MKKAMVVVGVVLALVVAVSLIPLTNNLCACVQLSHMRRTPLPAQTVCEDGLWKVGRFVGTGDGTQYFTAILVRSERSVFELREWYEPYGYKVKPQWGQQVDVLERSPVLRFEHEKDDDATYFIVYRLKDGIPPFAWLDVRGC